MGPRTCLVAGGVMSSALDVLESRPAKSASVPSTDDWQEALLSYNELPDDEEKADGKGLSLREQLESRVAHENSVLDGLVAELGVEQVTSVLKVLCMDMHCLLSAPVRGMDG